MSEREDKPTVVGLITIFEEIFKFFKKYSFWDITKTLFYLFFWWAIYYGFTHHQEIIEYVMVVWEQRKEDYHVRSIEETEKNIPLIYERMSETKDILNADRIFIFDLHNGSNSLGGISYLHTTMRYELAKLSAGSIKFAYQNIDIRDYQFISYVYDSVYESWSGTIDSLMTIYPIEAEKLKSAKTTYLYIRKIGGRRTHSIPLGFVGITYVEDSKIPNEYYIDTQMKLLSAELTSLLRVDIYGRNDENENENRQTK